MSITDAIVGGLCVAAAAIAVWVVAELGARQRLPRQRWAGIRLAETMKSDEAWRVAHLAAAPLLRIAGGIAVVSGLGAAVAGVYGAFVAVNICMGVAVVALVGGTLGAIRPALRAARRVR